MEKGDVLVLNQQQICSLDYYTRAYHFTKDGLKPWIADAEVEILPLCPQIPEK